LGTTNPLIRLLEGSPFPLGGAFPRYLQFVAQLVALVMLGTWLTKFGIPNCSVFVGVGVVNYPLFDNR
jgi:hypothetical protein